MGLFILIIAVLNSVMLTAIFISYIKGRELLARRLGMAYLFLAVPAAVVLCIEITAGAAAETIIFLTIFLAHLFIEWLYDFKLKLDFRRNWKLLVSL